jgi:glucose/arabinose dehydrogenase
MKLLPLALLSLLLFTLTFIQFANSQPMVLNRQFKVEKIFEGHFEPSNMAFLDADNILVLDRDEGKIFRITHGVQSGPLLDVNVATDGYRGMLGVAVTPNEKGITNVFLYFTQARTHDGDDKTSNPVNPLGNRLYKYDLINNKLVNPGLLLDLPALPGPRHAGGEIAIGPDKNVYLTIGDLDGTFRYKRYETIAQNYMNGTAIDGRSGILVVTQDGRPTSKEVLGNSFPLNLYYAYGIRNSFGIDWDPRTGYLWDSENGPHFGDELNLVLPGFNSGWAEVQGIWKPNVEDIGPVNLQPNDLVNFNGRGTYSSPKFIWLDPAAPSAVKFLNSDKYGPQYKDDLLVGDANNGYIYDFNLDRQRKSLDLSGELSDKIANNTGELNDVVFAKGFGKVADIEMGPDGLLYVLASEKQFSNIYRISLR